MTGPDGLLKALTKTVLEAALQEEMTEHPVITTGTPRRAWKRETHATDLNKKVITDACGQVEIVVPSDRNGTFRAGGSGNVRRGH